MLSMYRSGDTKYVSFEDAYDDVWGWTADADEMFGYTYEKMFEDLGYTKFHYNEQTVRNYVDAAHYCGASRVASRLIVKCCELGKDLSSTTESITDEIYRRYKSGESIDRVVSDITDRILNY